MLGDVEGFVEVVREVGVKGSVEDMKTLVRMREEGLAMGIFGAWQEWLVGCGLTGADHSTEQAVTCRFELVQEILDEFHGLLDRLADDDNSEATACVGFGRRLGERLKCRSAMLRAVRRKDAFPEDGGYCDGFEWDGDLFFFYC